VKWDGVRAVARSEPGRLALIARNGNDVTAAHPEEGVTRAYRLLRDAMADAEHVAIGHPHAAQLGYPYNLFGDPKTVVVGKRGAACRQLVAVGSDSGCARSWGPRC
jgi:hypothetical protein